MKKQVQVRGEFAGSVGGWRPAITGTLNQTGLDDAEASTCDAHEVTTLVELVLLEGARPDYVRVVDVEEVVLETGKVVR